MVTENCPRCFGRGYLPEKRRPSKRNPNGLGFYARNCPRCGGCGTIPSVAIDHRGIARTALAKARGE